MSAKRSKTPPPPGLSASDVERLDTWMPEIGDKILGHLHVEANGSFRVGEKRNLVIRPGGSFYDYSTSSMLVSNVVSLHAPKTIVVSKDAPAGLKDVNDLHQHDQALVKTLLDAATERPFGLPESTINLIIDEACNLKRIAWQRNRERIAKLIGWKVSALDKERDARIAVRIARAEKEGAFQGADETRLRRDLNLRPAVGPARGLPALIKIRE